MKNLFETLKVIVNVALLGGDKYKELECVTID